MDCPRWLGVLLGGADLRSAAEIERDIDEELDAHLAFLADEREAAGDAPSAARREANRRFGSRELYRKQCRDIDMGDRIMFQRIAIGAAVVLAGLTAYLLWEVRTMRRQHADAMVKLSSAVAALQNVERTAESLQTAARLAASSAAPQVDAPAAQPPTLADIVGRVVDENAEALSDVQLLVIVKTWPHDRYRQRAYHTVSQPDGSFALDELLPTGEQYAVQIAALRSGYTLCSTYQLIEEGVSDPLPPVELELRPAAPVQLAIEDAQGHRIRGAKIIPAGRTTADGETHSVYFQAAEPAVATTDERGEINLDWCAASDRAELYVQLPGEEWQSYTVAIPVERASALILTANGDNDGA